jgi:hypothetical protein
LKIFSVVTNFSNYNSFLSIARKSANNNLLKRKKVSEKLVEIKVRKSVSRNVILKIILSANGLPVPDSRTNLSLRLTFGYKTCAVKYLRLCPTLRTKYKRTNFKNLQARTCFIAFVVHWAVSVDRYKTRIHCRV